MIEEIHPWGVFPNNGKGSKLILGSFPPKRFTDIEKHLLVDDVDFFYGSRDNNFWELFCNSKDLDFDWRLNLGQLKKYLIDNNWIVSDIILNTKRRNDNALDRDLLVIEWNIKIIKELIENNKIETIYFTSKWVQERFCEKIALHLNAIPKLVTLISPSRSGLMSLNWAREILLQLEKESNKEYRQGYYIHFLNK